jgi:hypothetical protein
VMVGNSYVAQLLLSDPCHPCRSVVRICFAILSVLCGKKLLLALIAECRLLNLARFLQRINHE